MRRFLPLLVSVYALAACDRPETRVLQQPVAVAPRETVFVQGSNGEQWLLLCAAGVICNHSTGTVVHHYPVGTPYPLAYSRYNPASAGYYVRQQAYRERYYAPQAVTRPRSAWRAPSAPSAPSTGGYRPSATPSGYGARPSYSGAASPRSSSTGSGYRSTPSYSAPRSTYSAPRSSSSGGYRSSSSSGGYRSSSSGSRSSGS